MHAEGGEFSFDGGATGVYQHASDDQTDDELSGSVDLFLHWRVSAGEWLVYVEGSSGPDADSVSARFPNANADAGSVIDKNGNGRIQLSELNFTFNLDGRQSLMLGLVDPSAWLDRSRRANDENQHFLNESFVNNVTIAFPDYTLGAVYRLPAEGSLPEITLVTTGSDGIADLPGRSYPELFDLSDDGRGAFIGLGASWVREQIAIRAGAWLRTDDHPVIDRPASTDHNYGAYGVLGWNSGKHAIIVRGGIANEHVSVPAGFAAFAYERELRIGLFGVGVARTFVSDRLSSELRRDGTDAELILRIPLLWGRAHLTPSVQYVRNPGLDPADATSGSSATIVGLRLRWNF